jgi:hypothetical protein
MFNWMAVLGEVFEVSSDCESTRQYRTRRSSRIVSKVVMVFAGYYLSRIAAQSQTVFYFGLTQNPPALQKSG